MVPSESYRTISVMKLEGGEDANEVMEYVSVDVRLKDPDE